MRKIVVLSIVMGLMIFIRACFDNNEAIVYIVAGLNIVAIAFVIYTVVEKISKNVIKKIKESKVPEKVVDREVKSTRLKIWGTSIGIGGVFVVTYCGWLCSGLGNDIISILALGISVMDDEIVRLVTDIYKI